MPAPTIQDIVETTMQSTMYQRVRAKLEAQEAAMQRQMREALGPPSAQHERLEALIGALDPRHATGIDRTAASWWKTSG